MNNRFIWGPAPKPPEFNALGESKGAEKRRTEAKASAPPSSPHLGAQVALQQSLILRVGKTNHNLGSRIKGGVRMR
jgi:hypothetical protein